MKKISSVIKGIPSRSDYGDLSKLKAKEFADWIVQHHLAEKAGPHYDIRFGTPDTGLYSWAVRKGLPESGKKHLAVRQPIHSYDYQDFEGRIHKGYGKGDVKKIDQGKILITRLLPDRINFTLAHKRYPERFTLIKPKKGKEHDWLLINTTPKEPLPYKKIRYTKLDADKVESVLKTLKPGTSVQAKIDGASSLIKLLKDKIELVSYRASKIDNRPIVHTERIFGTIPDIETPKEYQGSILRGELFGTKDDKAIPPQELSGLLNSSIYKSRTDQTNRNIDLKNLIFDVQQIGKKSIDFNQHNYEERLSSIKDILSKIIGNDSQLVKDKFLLPEEAKSPEESLNLWKRIRKGKHPLTTEGIIIHPSTGKPIKSKFMDEYDVFIRGFYPGSGKYKDNAVGGFIYSMTPDGPILGEVGTGFDDLLRRDMYINPSEYIGRLAKVRSQQVLPSGALRAPALLSLHEDYPQAEAK